MTDIEKKFTKGQLTEIVAKVLENEPQKLIPPWNDYSTSGFIYDMDEFDRVFEQMRPSDLIDLEIIFLGESKDYFIWESSVDIYSKNDIGVEMNCDQIVDAIIIY